MRPSVAFTALSLIIGWPRGAAAAALACPDDDRATLLREDPARLEPCAHGHRPLDHVWAAHAELALGSSAAAARLYSAAANEPTLKPIRPALLVTAAASLGSAGRVDEGLRLLATAPPVRPWLRSEIAALRSDLLLRAGRATPAIAAAREALRLKHGGADALWLTIARAAVSAGNQAAYREAVKALRVTYPESPAAAAAERIRPPSWAPASLTPAESAKRWATWTSHGGASPVAAECSRQLGVGAVKQGLDSVLAAGRLACGKAMATTHAKGAGDMLRLAAQSPSTRAAALLTLAHIAAKGSDPTPIRALCDQLAAAQAQNELAECSFLVAFVTRQSGDVPGARVAFQQVVDTFPQHPRAADAAWFVALDAIHSPDPVPVFDSLLSVAHDTSDRARALYWRGRVRPDTEAAAAQADWEEARRIDPFGYYGWLASERLQPDPARPASTACATRGPRTTDQPPAASAMAQLLLKAGFARFAALELAEVAPIRGPDALGWTDFLADADQWERVLDIGVGHGGGGAGWPIDADKRAAVEATFPRAFPNALASVTAETDACLVLALMRRESRYNPDATSGAEAVGLLQLLPRTATALARELGDTESPVEHLHDPVTNVRLGAHYIQRLIDRFHNPLMAAAAYNGGPGSVANWTRSSAGLAIDEWVERIPFRETRNYVKAVGGTYAAYSLLYEGRRPAIDWTPIAPAGDGIDY